MTPTWPAILADPDVLTAIDDAIERFVRDGCVHEHRDAEGRPSEDPAWCDCDENKVDPREFGAWLRTEIRMSGARPVPKIEPAGRPNRERKADPRLTLAVAS